MTAILAASFSFSFMVGLAVVPAHAGPYKCGRYAASGVLKDPHTLVVNAGKQGETELKLTGKYQMHAKAGFAVEVVGDITKGIEDSKGELKVAKLKLIVPDPIAPAGDELRLEKVKPCR
jgi:hypothetical protein